MLLSKDAFLAIIRLGLGQPASIPNVVDWNAVEALAEQQGFLGETLYVVKGIIV